MLVGYYSFISTCLLCVYHCSDSAAAEAGVCKGDRIIKVNGMLVTKEITHEHLVNLIAGKQLHCGSTKYERSAGGNKTHVFLTLHTRVNNMGAALHMHHTVNQSRPQVDSCDCFVNGLVF